MKNGAVRVDSAAFQEEKEKKKKGFCMKKRIAPQCWGPYEELFVPCDYMIALRGKEVMNTIGTVFEETVNRPAFFRPGNEKRRRV